MYSVHCTVYNVYCTVYGVGNGGDGGDGDGGGNGDVLRGVVREGGMGMGR